MDKKYIVIWASHNTDAGDHPCAITVNRLTRKENGKYAGTEIFTSLTEAMRAARKDREKFISEEKQVQGDDVDIELINHKRWISAKSVYAIVTWAAIEILKGDDNERNDN